MRVERVFLDKPAVAVGYEQRVAVGAPTSGTPTPPGRRCRRHDGPAAQIANLDAPRREIGAAGDERSGGVKISVQTADDLPPRQAVYAFAVGRLVDPDRAIEVGEGDLSAIVAEVMAVNSRLLKSEGGFVTAYVP